MAASTGRCAAHGEQVIAVKLDGWLTTYQDPEERLLTLAVSSNIGSPHCAPPVDVALDNPGAKPVAQRVQLGLTVYEGVESAARSRSLGPNTGVSVCIFAEGRTRWKEPERACAWLHSKAFIPFSTLAGWGSRALDVNIPLYDADSGMDADGEFDPDKIAALYAHIEDTMTGRTKPVVGAVPGLRAVLRITRSEFQSAPGYSFQSRASPTLSAAERARAATRHLYFYMLGHVPPANSSIRAAINGFDMGIRAYVPPLEPGVIAMNMSFSTIGPEKEPGFGVQLASRTPGALAPVEYLQAHLDQILRGWWRAEFGPVNGAAKERRMLDEWNWLLALGPAPSADERRQARTIAERLAVLLSELVCFETVTAPYDADTRIELDGHTAPTESFTETGKYAGRSGAAPMAGDCEDDAVNIHGKIQALMAAALDRAHHTGLYVLQQVVNFYVSAIATAGVGAAKASAAKDGAASDYVCHAVSILAPKLVLRKMLAVGARIVHEHGGAIGIPQQAAHDYAPTPSPHPRLERYFPPILNEGTTKRAPFVETNTESEFGRVLRGHSALVERIFTDRMPRLRSDGIWTFVPCVTAERDRATGANWLSDSFYGIVKEMQFNPSAIPASHPGAAVFSGYTISHVDGELRSGLRFSTLWREFGRLSEDPDAEIDFGLVLHCEFEEEQMRAYADAMERDRDTRAPAAPLPCVQKFIKVFGQRHDSRALSSTCTGEILDAIAPLDRSALKSQIESAFLLVNHLRDLALHHGRPAPTRHDAHDAYMDSYEAQLAITERAGWVDNPLTLIMPASAWTTTHTAEFQTMLANGVVARVDLGAVDDRTLLIVIEFIDADSVPASVRSATSAGGSAR